MCSFAAVSPMYFVMRLWSCTNMSGKPHSPASAEAVIVLPQPGGPTSSSFRRGDKPCERKTVHEDQGWKLHRIWTPHFFRNVDGSLKAIMRDVQAALAEEIQLAEEVRGDNDAPPDGR
jgi:hypothetical protein